MKRRELIGTVLLLTTALTTAGATAAAHAAAAKATWGLQATRVMESARGAARMLLLPHGGFVAAHSFGAVERVDASGRTVWSRDTQSLYRDWRVTWLESGTTNAPQLAWGGSLANPLQFSGENGGALVNDTHPLAVGSLGGRDVVAVAETVGVDLTNQQSCAFCMWPFRVPGSNLHVGTFVSVLDARTGTTLYHELDPGYVTQLAIADGRLIVGEETGDPQRLHGIGAWGSVSTLRALAFSRDGRASLAWAYSTSVPWARLLDIAVTGGGIALAWSDTPPGLGTPRPPDGHVLLLDAGTGRLRWQQRTPGYPVLIAADDRHGELAVVQLTDPVAATGYTLTGLRYRDGDTALSLPRPGWAPVSLAVGPPGWAVGAANATRDRITLTGTGERANRWSAPVNGIPGGLAFAGDRLAVAAWVTAVTPSAADPLQQIDSLTFFDTITGRSIATRTGDPGDPLSLSGAGDSVAAINSHQVVTTYAANGSATVTGDAGPGDFLSAMTSPATGDLIAGNEDGSVYAFDGRDRIRWQTRLPGPVHQVVAARLGRKQVLLAAATSAVGVLDAGDGHLIRLIEVPGTYVYTITAIPGAVVVPGTSLTAYSLSDGSGMWRYAAPRGAWFSDAVTSDGTVAAEYSSVPVARHPASAMAAVAVRAATGAPLWTVRPDPAATLAGQLWNGVAVGPDGIAFAWATQGGAGRVEVRNPLTGALAYSDTSSALDQLTGYTRSAGFGLIAQSVFGATIIGPGGGQSSTVPSGMSAVVVGTAFLSAEELVSAWGRAVFTNPGASALATEDTYWTGALANVGPSRVAGLTGDFLASRIVRAETGVPGGAFVDLNQHGLALLTLTRSAAARAASVRPTTGPAMPLEPERTGIAHPFISGASKIGQAAYGPAQIRAYLRPSGNGTGQTIAIVDAYDDPAVVADAEAFSRHYGLPGVCGAGGVAGNCFTLDVREQNPSAGSDSGWALETSLDVEWAHAIAPRARIVLFEAGDARLSSLFGEVARATALRPAAVSMSWGIAGEFSDQTWYDHFCTVGGTVCVVAAGDYGHPGSYPAYNPAAVSVGGTTLSLTSSGSVSSELSWSGSGGGQSWVEPEPAYQDGAQHSGMRQIPDVSFDADSATGVAVFDSVPYNGQSGWWQVGGTSLGAPSWSAILADADQLLARAGKPPLTSPAPTVYSLPGTAIARITAGQPNGFCPVGCTPTSGYDEITGLGSPRSRIDAALAAGS